MMKVVTSLASGTIVIINTLLNFVMRHFSMAEQHETQTKMNVSVAFKLLIARFFNSSIILLLVNKDKSKWFKGGDLVYEATVLVGMLAFYAPFMELLYIPGIMKWRKKSAEMAKGDECELTQREANLLCEGGQIDPANSISNFMNMIMTCCFYSPIIPVAIPLAFVSSFCFYWVTKYSFLRRYKMPDMFGELMATFFSNFMPWLIFV